MLLENLVSILSYFKLYKHQLKKVVLILFIPLLLMKPQSYELMSKESLYPQIGDSESLLFTEKEVEYKRNSPHETILICLNNNNYFDDLLKSYIKKIYIRGKTVLFSNTDLNENYFLKIFIKESNITNISIFPMRKYQPNSDIFYLALEFFKSKNEINFKDIFYNKIENAIFINLENNQNDIKNFCLLLRLYMNIESYMYGIYYYVPYGNVLIRAEPFYFFILGVLILSIYDIELDLNPFKIVIVCIIYDFCPLICFMFLDVKYCFIFGFVFSVLNFRFGFLYCILIYLIMLKNQILTYYSNFNNKKN